MSVVSDKEAGVEINRALVHRDGEAFANAIVLNIAKHKLELSDDALKMIVDAAREIRAAKDRTGN